MFFLEARNDVESFSQMFRGYKSQIQDSAAQAIRRTQTLASVLL
jgi:hypothetical protein